MKIYRISFIDMMGFRFGERFFSSLKKARSEYAKLLVEYRNEKDIVKPGDENYLSSPIVRKEPAQDSVIKEYMIELWRKTSPEYDEWVTHVETIQLEIIDVA